MNSILKIKNFKNLDFIKPKFLKNTFILNSLISIFIGSFSFIFIYGTKAFTIFPKAFNDNDYLIYQASYYVFRGQQWNFPIFNSNKLFLQKEVNLILADYIPIYSIFLKFLENTLNIQFKNFLIFWIYLSTIFMFYISYKLFLHLDLSKTESTIGAFVISYLPASHFKFLYHSGEGSHFLIILGIYLYLKSKHKTRYIYQLGIITGLSLWVHFYIFTFLFGIYFIALINYKKKKLVILKTVSIFTIIASTIFILSFGSINSFKYIVENNISSEFNPRWSAEFNSFFCSKISNNLIFNVFKCYEPYTNTDIESYGYLGLGIILFLPILFFKFKENLSIVKSNKNLIFLSLIYLIFAFGNRFKISHKQIFEYQFTDLHLKLIKIYRAHGRFIYLFYYLLIFLVLYNIFKISKNSKLKYLVVILFLLVQIVDLNHQYLNSSFNSFKYEIEHKDFQNIETITRKNVASRLFIYPLDNCFEDFDMFFFAKEFLKIGGSINGSRIRGGSNLINCQESNIYSSLFEYDPVHFIITENEYLKFEEKILENYSCQIFKGYFKNTNFLYCSFNF